MVGIEGEVIEVEESENQELYSRLERWDKRKKGKGEKKSIISFKLNINYYTTITYL